MSFMAAPQSTVPRRAVFLLIALTLVWGTNWPMFTLAVREVSVWTFRSVTMIVGGVVLLALSRTRGESLVIERKYWVTIGLGTMCRDPQLTARDRRNRTAKHLDAEPRPRDRPHPRPDDVVQPFPRTGRGLVEVVDVEDQVAFG